MLAQRRHAEIDRVADVDRMCCFGRTVEEREPQSAPWRATGAGEDPSIGGVSGRVDQRDADCTMVGVIEAGGPTVAEVDRDQHLWSVTADDRRDVAPQYQRRFDEAVGMGEELDGVDADNGRRAAFLLLSEARSLVGRQ